MSKSKMTTCKACGHEIYAKGKVTCPSCGKVSKKPFYKRGWFIGLVIIMILASVGGNESDETSSTALNDDSEKIEVTKMEEVKDPLIVTVDGLMDELDENALKASETYKNQYVELTGDLDVIDSSGDYIGLGRMNTDYGIITVRCKIKKEHQNQVLNMNKDDRVTLLGTIEDVGEIMGYSLKVDRIIGGEEAEIEMDELKEPVIISVDDLVDDLHENSLKASNIYKGKQVELTGKVVTIDSSGKYFSIGRMDDSFSLDTVYCGITSEHLQNVMELKDGQNITVIGTIENVGEVMGYTVKVKSIK